MRARTIPVAVVVATAALAGCGAATGSGTGPGRTSAGSTAAEPTATSSGWSAPMSLAGMRSLLAVSCPATSFCMAVGRGQAVAYSSGHWQTPQTIDQHRGLNSGLVTVSCVSATFCLAGDGRGGAFSYNGRRWSGSTLVSSAGLIQISCASQTFCAAVDVDGSVRLWNGSNWTVPNRVGAGPISCPSDGFCLTLGSGGGTDTSRLAAGRWTSAGSLPVSAPQGGSEPNTGSAVACVSSSFCGALDDFGEAFTWTRGRWSAPVQFDPNLLNNTDALSCPQANTCVAVDVNGLSTRWNGRSWSKAERIDSAKAGLWDVSCAGARLCTAVDLSGHVLTYR